MPNPKAKQIERKLTAGKVHAIVKDSMYKDAELAGKPPGAVPEDAIVVEGIVRTFSFHPERLMSHRQEVEELLAELPLKFREENGGGWTFLNMVLDKDDYQWGEQVSAEELMCLGIGLELMTNLLPRDVWPALSGGVPYLCIRKAA